MRRLFLLLAILVLPSASAGIEPAELHPGRGITNAPSCHSHMAILFEFTPTGGRPWDGVGVVTGASACTAFRVELPCRTSYYGVQCLETRGVDDYTRFEYRPATDYFYYNFENATTYEDAEGRML